MGTLDLLPIMYHYVAECDHLFPLYLQLWYLLSLGVSLDFVQKQKSSRTIHVSWRNNSTEAGAILDLGHVMSKKTLCHYMPQSLQEQHTTTHCIHFIVGMVISPESPSVVSHVFVSISYCFYFLLSTTYYLCTHMLYLTVCTPLT